MSVKWYIFSVVNFTSLTQDLLAHLLSVRSVLTDKFKLKEDGKYTSYVLEGISDFVGL